MIYMFLSNNPLSGDINSSNLLCLHSITVLCSSFITQCLGSIGMDHSIMNCTFVLYRDNFIN